MTPEKLIALQGIVGTLAYQAILDVMEEICDKADMEARRTHPNNPQVVLAEHAIAHAQDIFFQEVQSRISQLVADAKGEKPLDNRELAKQKVRRIQSPLD